MSLSPNHEALRTLAAFSVDEEFCQKFGGKLFGYTGVPTPAYRQLCLDFSLLLDRMSYALVILKSHIPTSQNNLRYHLGNSLGDGREDGPRTFQL
jgi:hypothetical protein